MASDLMSTKCMFKVKSISMLDDNGLVQYTLRHITFANSEKEKMMKMSLF